MAHLLCFCSGKTEDCLNSTHNILYYGTCKPGCNCHFRLAQSSSEDREKKGQESEPPNSELKRDCKTKKEDAKKYYRVRKQLLRKLDYIL